MSANERRAEIIKILTACRSETAPRLARELGVSVCTVRRDIQLLMADYPLETQQGNGGCVKVADWYHPHRHILSNEQQRVLMQLMSAGDEQQTKVLRELLTEYGSPKYRQMIQKEENAEK